MKKIYTIMAISLLLATGCSLTPIEQGTRSNTQPAGNNPVKADTTLDLSGQNLKQVPEYVFAMTKLESLDLSDNQLTGAIQAEIRKLQNLRSLDASNNQMTGLPAEIGQLQKLEILNVADNQLTGLPYELGNLKNIKTFNISGNPYSQYDLGIIEAALPDSVNIIK